MKTFLQDLAKMPEFYRYKRQGLIWLELNSNRSIIFKCQHASDKLVSAGHAYERLNALMVRYVSTCGALGLLAGALVIAQLARVASF